MYLLQLVAKAPFSGRPLTSHRKQVQWSLLVHIGSTRETNLLTYLLINRNISGESSLTVDAFIQIEKSIKRQTELLLWLDVLVWLFPVECKHTD